MGKNLNLWTSDGEAPPDAAGVRDVTVSNCIIAEGLLRDDNHHMGYIITEHAHNVTILRNLAAHNGQRNPVAKGDTSTVIVNNVCYNAGTAAIHFYDYANLGPIRSAIVGNVILPGPSTTDDSARRILIRTPQRAEAKYYLADNDAPLSPLNESGQDIYVNEPPLWPPELDVLPTEAVLEHVLENAGVRPWERDLVDRRIVASVRERTGRIVDEPEDVGGWPEYGTTHRPLNVPENAGETLADGYTVLEHWVREFENNAPNGGETGLAAALKAKTIRLRGDLTQAEETLVEIEELATRLSGVSDLVVEIEKQAAALRELIGGTA